MVAGLKLLLPKRVGFGGVGQKILAKQNEQFISCPVKDLSLGRKGGRGKAFHPLCTGFRQQDWTHQSPGSGNPPTALACLCAKLKSAPQMIESFV